LGFSVIFGIGVDVVQISRIDSISKRWGKRFLGRVFTNQEREYCLLRKDPSPHFAVRFAAKEAFLKALGTGYTQGVRWKDIEIVPMPSGKPDLKLYDRTERLLQRHGIRRIHLSMSHDGEYGFVQVILEV
jgi:holo-[acyl-carrier protein] synthase